MGGWLGGWRDEGGGGVNVPCKVHLIVLQRKVLQYTQNILLPVLFLQGEG